MANSPSVPTFETLNDFCGDLRSLVFRTQTEAARRFGVHHTTVVRYEKGEVRPPLSYLIGLALLVADRLDQMGKPAAATRKSLMVELNKAVQLCYADETPLENWGNLQLRAKSNKPSEAGSALASSAKSLQDWGAAPDVGSLLGRERELSQMQTWLTSGRTRLILLAGLPGMGKTWLSVAASRQAAPTFDALIWRSLRFSPSLTQFLAELTVLLGGRVSQESVLSSAAQIAQFIDLLRHRRVLLILDAFDSVK